MELPTTWHFFTYSKSGLWIMGAVLLICLVGSRWVSERAATRLVRAGTITAGTLVVLSHALVSWILARDPERITGTVPLPEPFASSAVLAVLLAHLVVPALTGGFVPWAVKTKRTVWGVAAFLVVIYAAWVLPWAAHYLFD